MGFPTWTLWGMGGSALAAVLALSLALLALSPKATRRLGLSGLRLDLRARALTGYALALLLLAFGFFVAGVPLEGGASGSVEPIVLVVTATPEAGTGFTLATLATDGAQSPALTPTAGTPASGAFAGPPAATSAVATPGESGPAAPSTPTTTPDAATAAGAEAPQSTATAALTATPTGSPTPTQSPTPTTTPTPTMTPTPISGATATINASASTLWLRRTPGGSLVVQMDNGATVLLLSRRASYGGELWQEISTLDGAVGWVRADLLVFDE